MNKTKDPNAKALQLVNQLISELSDSDQIAHALQLRARIQLPIKEIMDKVPGDNIAAKARALNISRPALYGWTKGGRRPRPKEAQRLSQITGLPWQAIAGLPS